MSRRALLALSAASTAFLLVIAGAVASYALPRAQPSAGNTRLPGNHAVLSAIARPEPQPAVSGPVFEREDDGEARETHTRTTAHREDDDG